MSLIVDAAQHQASALVQLLERRGYDLARGREHDGCVERDRGRIERGAGPARAQLFGELSMHALARTHVDLGATGARDLDGDVPGGAESRRCRGARPETQPAACARGSDSR
jgi:hypothetical protein